MDNQKATSEIVSSLLDRVRENVSRYVLYTECAEEQEETVRQLFLDDANESPEEPVGDTLYEDRYDKWYVVAEALRAELCQQRGLESRQLRLLIDVMGNDFADRVYVTFIYTRKADPERGVLLYTSSARFDQRFATLTQFEAYLGQEYRRLEEGYERVEPPGPSAASQKKLFLARFEVRCGEHQFPLHHTIKTDDIEAAKTRARQHVQGFYLGDPELDEDWFVFLGGEVAVRCVSVEETTPERLATRLAL